MVHATFQKRFSAVPVAVVLLGLGQLRAHAQEEGPNFNRVNQDELASFYGRMNVVVGSGARAFGMGGAFLARADDATAASWNPAGLSYLRRTEFSVVGVHNDFSQRIPRVNDAVSPIRLVTTLDQLRGSVADFAGFAYPFRIKERSGAIQISYQRSFSFTGTRRSEGTIEKAGFRPDGGLVLPTEFTVDGKGGFDTLSVSSGFELRSDLRIGVSLNHWIHGFSQTVDRPARTTITSDWEIEGSNFNFGLIFTPSPKLNLGGVLKTGFGADVQLNKSRVDTVETKDPITGEVSKTSLDNGPNSGDVRIRFPRVYGLGASFRASNTITLSADFTRTDWSKSTITGFFALAQKDVKPPIDEYPLALPFPAVEEGAEGQSDTNQVRVGAEWVLRLGQSGNVLLPLRAGFFRDGQPVAKRLKISETADVQSFKPTFTGLTAGLGVTVGGVLLDVAYIREVGSVPASRYGNEVRDEVTRVRYNRIFASIMVRFGPRR